MNDIFVNDSASRPAKSFSESQELEFMLMILFSIILLPSPAPRERIKTNRPPWISVSSCCLQMILAARKPVYRSSKRKRFFSSLLIHEFYGNFYFYYWILNLCSANLSETLGQTRYANEISCWLLPADNIVSLSHLSNGRNFQSNPQFLHRVHFQNSQNSAAKKTKKRRHAGEVDTEHRESEQAEGKLTAKKCGN